MNKYSLDFGTETNKKLDDFYLSHQALIVNFALKCKNNGFSCLKFQNDLMRLAVCLEYLKYTKVEYDRLGIDEKIFFDTIKDIEIWCSNNNNKGLKNYNWIKNHLKCELFKIGRLQYQIYRCNNATLNYQKLPFSFGDNLIYVHIPQGEKLNYDDCVASLSMAKSFFSKHFPEFSYKYYFSESWLLDSKNNEFMDEDCNIIKFQSLLVNHYDFLYDGQAIERVFGKRRLFVKNYPDNSSLQKRLKAYMLNGGKAGIGVASIDVDTL